MTAPHLHIGCIGLASSEFPPLGIEGVAVWPLIGASGRCNRIVAAVRRQLMWATALRALPSVEHLVVCRAPRWAVARMQRTSANVTVVADATAAHRAIAALRTAGSPNKHR